MIKGILFDKDGTIIDFYALWLTAALEVVPKFIVMNGIEASEEIINYVLEVIGVYDKKIDPKGALAYKTYIEIAEDIVSALEDRNILLDKMIVNQQLQCLFDEGVTGPHVELRTFCDMHQLLDQLKSLNIRIGLSTADTIVSAKSCLETLGIYDEFDYIGADDGVKHPKPAPDMFVEFRELFGLESDEIMVVGDTQNDIRFAKENGGVAVGVLSGVSTQKDYERQADYIIESIVDLPELLERI